MAVNMRWLYIQEAEQIVKKSGRTIRIYLQKHKENNPNLSTENNIYRYHIDSKNVKKLQVSSLFLQTYFNVDIPPLQKGVEGVETEVKQEPIVSHSDMESKYEQRLEEMKRYYEKQLVDITEAKQQTIDVLKEQLDKTDHHLNKVLDQYSLAQLTIQNLTTPQLDKPYSIDNDEQVEEVSITSDVEQIDNPDSVSEEQDSNGAIHQENEMTNSEPKKMKTTEEYYAEHYPQYTPPNSGLGKLLDDETDSK
jgi:hypothetical protein